MDLNHLIVRISNEKYENKNSMSSKFVLFNLDSFFISKIKSKENLESEILKPLKCKTKSSQN